MSSFPPRKQKAMGRNRGFAAAGMVWVSVTRIGYVWTVAIMGQLPPVDNPHDTGRRTARRTEVAEGRGEGNPGLQPLDPVRVSGAARRDA